MISKPPPARPASNWLRTPLGALFSVQLLACLPVAILLLIHPDLGTGSALLVQSVCAAVLSQRVMRQGRWWLPVHLLFMPALLIASRLPVAPHWYLLILLFMLLLFGAAWRGNVPLFISSDAALRALDEVLPRTPGLRFIDIGCGSGAVLAAVARCRPDWQIVGVEAAWLPWLWARLRVAMLGSRVCVLRQNFWAQNLPPADVAYAYLSPTPMLALLRKLQQEGQCRYLISYRFSIPGVEPELQLQTADGSLLLRWDLRKVNHGR